MIHVIAIITAHPGQLDKVIDAFRENTPAVLAEAGCLEYSGAVDAEGIPKSRGTFGPDTFVVVEKWASLEHLQAHAVAPHMTAYGARVKEWVASRVLHILQPA